jgi:hypothetical protein
MIRIHSATYTCAEENRTLLNFQRYFEQLHESFRHNACSSHTFYFTQDDREFFFSRTGYRIHSSQAPGQHRCHPLHALVFHNFSMSIVGLLKSIDRQTENGSSVSTFSRRSQSTDQLYKQSAIWQPG